MTGPIWDKSILPPNESFPLPVHHQDFTFTVKRLKETVPIKAFPTPLQQLADTINGKPVVMDGVEVGVVRDAKVTDTGVEGAIVFHPEKEVAPTDVVETKR